MPDRIGRLARRARPPKRTESTDVFPVIPAQDSSAEQLSAETSEVDAPDTPDPETTRGQTPQAETPEPEAPEPEAPQSPESGSAEQPTAAGPSRLVEIRGRAARFGVGFLRLVLLAAVLALAWLVDQARVQVPRARIWLRPRAIRLTVTVVAGVLLWTSYPLLNWWWAAIVAFGALAWVLTRPATTPGGGFGYGFLFGVAFYLPLIRWIDLMVGPALLLVLVVMCALFTGLFGLGAVTVRRLPGWPVWFALLWTAQEWLKCTVPFGGFPWGVVAAGQTSGPFLPLVRLGGVPLLSLAIVLTGCGAAAFLVETVTWWAASRRRHDPAQRTAGDDEIADTPPAVIVPALCVCVTFFLAAAVWPQVRHSGNGSGNEPTVTAAVVQGNVPRLGLEFNAQRLAVLGNDVRETRRLADDIHAGRAPQPDFVIWPEDASEIDPTENPDAAQEISSAVDAIGVPILVGTVLDLPNRRDNEPAQTNTVIVWNPQSGPGDRHDKRIVQPFGEYLPWRGFFRHLSGMADMAGYIVPGTGSGVVHARGTAIGIATCWEVSFDRALRHSVRNGAQILAVPANNANFNQAMSEQQLAFSKLRAVELDRYTLVASNVGISAFVTPDGRELRRTGFFTPAYLDGQVRLKTTTTPAATWGPVVQGGLVIAALAVLVAAILHNGWLTELSRRLSGLAKRTRRSPKDTDGSDETDDDAADDSRPADDEEPGDTARHTARPGPDEGEL